LSPSILCENLLNILFIFFRQQTSFRNKNLPLIALSVYPTGFNIMT